MKLSNGKINFFFIHLDSYNLSLKVSAKTEPKRSLGKYQESKTWMFADYYIREEQQAIMR